MATENHKVQIAPEVNPEPAKKGFSEIADAGRKMADDLGRSGERAGKGMDGVGAGSERAAQKVERDTRNIIGSIERATAKFKAGGVAGADYFEQLGKQRGVSAEVLKPYLDQLRQAEGLHNAASRSLGKVGVSAKQTEAALRGVPAQFTDIVVALQGGQQPLTVFLQQGGQLKDMFGGAGAAAKALGGYVLGLVNPFTVVAALAAAGALAYNQATRETDAYRNAIINSGNAAGTTVTQLKAHAVAIDDVVGTQAKAAESLAEMAATGKVAGGNLREFTTAAIQWERATGQAVAETATRFSDLRDAPLQAVLKLNDGMNFLTMSTYQQIRSLEEQGKATEAAQVAQQAYADALASRAGEMEANLGTVERGWKAVKDAAKEAWDEILNIGRAQSKGDALADMQASLARVEKELAGAGFAETAGGAVTGRRMDNRRRAQLEGERAALQEQIKLMRQSIDLENERAATQARESAQVKARAEWDKEGLKYLADREKLERSIVEMRERGLAAGASQADIDAREAKMRADAAKKVGSGAAPGGENAIARINAAIKAEEEYIARLREHGDMAEKVSEADKEVARIQEQLKGSISGTARALKEEELARAKVWAATVKTREAEERSVKALKEARDTTAKQVQETERQAEAIDQQAAALEAQNAVWGLGRTAVAQHTLAMLENTLAQVDATDAADPKYIASLNAKIAAQRRFVDALNAADFKQFQQQQTEAARQVAEMTASAQLELSLVGATAEQRAAILAQREVELKYAKEIAGIERSTLGAEEKAELIRQARLNQAGEMAAVRMRSQASEVGRLIDSADNAAREAFLSIGDEGVNAFERIGRSLQTAVLDALYEMTLRKWVIQLAASVLGTPQGALQQSGSTGSGGLPSLSNVSSLASSGGMAGAIGSGASWLGSAFGSSTLTSFGAGMQGATLGAGLMGPTTAGAGGAMGLGAAAAKAIPYVGWAVAIASVVKSFLDNRNKWSGAFGEASVTDGTATAGGNSTFTNSTYSAEIAKGTQTIAQGIADAATAYGVAGIDFNLRQFSATASKKDRAQAGTDFFVNGQFFSTGSAEVSKSEQAGVFAQQAQRAMLKVLQETVTGRFGDYFKSVDALTGDIEAVQQVLATADAVRTFGESALWMGGIFDSLATLGVQSTADLASAAGGFDALAQSSARAYELLYTEQERLGFLTADVAGQFAKLGQEVPASAEEYRTALENAREGMLAGVPGAEKLYATLLALVPAWDQTRQAAETATNGILKNLQDQGQDLEVDLLRSQGREAEARALQRQNETAGYDAATLAAYDHNQAIRDQIEVNKEATRAAEQAAQDAARALETMTQRIGNLTSQADAARIELYRSQGRNDLADTLQFRADTTGMGEAEIAIYRMVTALKAQTEANKAATASAEEAAKAQQEAAKQAELAALDARQQAAQAAYDVARERVSELEQLGSLLADSVRSIYGEVASTIQQQAREGRGFIARSLAQAIATGYLPDSEMLSQAIDDARAGIEATPYATQFEQDREKLVLAGQLAQLDAIRATQQTVDEKQLDVQQRILKEIQSQRAKATADAAGNTGSTPTGSTTPTPTRPDLSGITATAAYLSANKDVAAAYQQNTYGLTLDEFVREHYRRYGRAEGRLSPEEELRRLGIPSYDIGTDYVPRDTLAYVHQGERITPRATVQQEGQAMAAMAERLQGMEAVLTNILTEQRAGNRSAKATADALSRAVPVKVTQ